MNPQPVETNSSNSQPTSTQQNGDGIFVLQPEPQKPVDKKTVWLTVFLTVLGILVLIAVFIFAIIGSAGSLADDYSGRAVAQLKKIDKPLDDLEPSLVLNKRNIQSPMNKIYVSDQAQPSLENTLFFGGLSAKYVAAQKLQMDIKSHYNAVNNYADQLKKLIKFQDGLVDLSVQEADNLKQLNPNDSLSLRSAGGSYDNLATQLKKLDAPDQLKALQTELLENYSDRSNIYTQWAVALEAGDKSQSASFQQQLQTLSDKAKSATNDKEIVALLTPTYKELLANQKTLESKPSN